MRLELPYGNSAVAADIPDGWNISFIEGLKADRLPAPAERLEECLDNPVGASSFNEIFRGKKNAAVIIPDITRKAGIDIILPVILSRLEELGIGRESVTIIFATGIHSPQVEEQRREAVGSDIFENYKCVDHDPNGEVVKIDLPGDAPFELNKTAADADGLIVIGGVKPHYLAGFGGGRKMILPGISSTKDCMEFHKLCLNLVGKGRHPGIGPVTVNGNPMHERASGAAKAAGVDFLINTVLNKKGGIAFINAGGLFDSFEEACRFAAAHSVVKLNRRYDIVIASAGGYPGDINFIQSHKSLDSACRAAKPGGLVILLAECAEGIGGKNFLRWLDYRTLDEMEKALGADFAINGHTALATREKAGTFKIFMVSALAETDVKRMGIIPVESFEEAVKNCEKFHAGRATAAAVIRNAGFVLPYRETGKGQ